MLKRIRPEHGIVAGLLVLFLVLGWRGREPAAVDDALTYIALSKSLEHGSYREIFRASAPLHVQYPPAYPAWLVVARHVVGEQHDSLRAATLVLVALSLLLFYGASRRLLGIPLALGLLLLLVLNQRILAVAGSLYSDGPYLLVATLALVGASVPEGPDRKRVGWVIALALIAFLTRSVGITLVFGVGVWLWSRRRGALAAWAAASVLVVGGWFAYTVLARAPTVRSYSSDFMGTGAGSAGLFSRLARRVASHIVGYGPTDLPYSLSLPTIPGTLVDNLAWMGILAVLLGVGIVVLWRQWRAAAAYLLGYVGLLLLWPWQDSRLLAVVIPLAMLTFLLGARHLAGRLRPPARAPVLAGLVLLLVIGAVRGVAEHLARYPGCDRDRPTRGLACYPEVERNVVEAGEYLRGHVAPPEVVVTDKLSLMAFVSGLPTEPSYLLYSAAPEHAAEFLRTRSIRFVLVRRFGPTEMGSILLESCRDFRIEADFAGDGLLLAVKTPGEGGSNACDRLAAFVRDVGPDPESNRP